MNDAVILEELSQEIMRGWWGFAFPTTFCNNFEVSETACFHWVVIVNHFVKTLTDLLMFNRKPQRPQKDGPKRNFHFCLCFPGCYLYSKYLFRRYLDPKKPAQNTRHGAGTTTLWSFKFLAFAWSLPKSGRPKKPLCFFFSLEVVGHPKDDDIPRKEVGCLDFFVGWIDGDKLLDDMYLEKMVENSPHYHLEYMNSLKLPASPT